MPRARKDPADDPALDAPAIPVATRSARRWLVQLLLPLALGAGLLGGVLWLGQYFTARLRDAGEHTIAFTDIECDSPPGMTRVEFLGEAQYLANLPDRLNALAPETRQQMFDALALHPWVARVRLLEFPSPGVVRADLEFRRPALLVPPNRVVDGEGVLLQANASARGLPRLRGKVRAPVSRAGQLWDDPNVVAATRVAALLRDAGFHPETPGEIGFVSGAIVLELGKTRILWGSAPGQESPGEARAAVKVQRLAAAGMLDATQWDVRPEGGMSRAPRD